MGDVVDDVEDAGEVYARGAGGVADGGLTVARRVWHKDGRRCRCWSMVAKRVAWVYTPKHTNTSK